MKPLCPCHAAPMAWGKDSRYRGGGYWRCSVRHNAHSRLYYAEKSAARKAAVSAYYHDRGGWIKKRRRALSAQRNRIMEQLAQLAEERTRC
jgi:hypothetical protein